MIAALLKFNNKVKSIETPVVGSLEQLDTPTSSDVHLFPDPSTASDTRPCLYADCEGLDGGNKDPVAISAEKMGRDAHRRRQKIKGKIVKLKWAGEQQCSRGWMVKNFYPRILFTFSDVVCYVTRNFR